MSRARKAAAPGETWKAMMLATPRRNEAAAVEEMDSTIVISVRTRRPRWLVPPVTWIVRTPQRRRLVLDGIGARVWGLCDGTRTVEGVIDAFAAAYRLSFHEARASVVEYVKGLVRRGALAIELAQDREDIDVKGK